MAKRFCTIKTSVKVFVFLFSLAMLFFSIPTVFGVDSDNEPPILQDITFKKVGYEMILEGNLENGFILKTTNDGEINHHIELNSISFSEEVKTGMIPLFLSSLQGVTGEELENYYESSKEDPWKTYLIEAVDGLKPFAYLELGETKIHDGLHYNMSQAGNTKTGYMIIPDDYPLGAYTVVGEIEDLTGNKANIYFTLVIEGDRIPPEITITGFKLKNGADLKIQNGAYILNTDNNASTNYELQFKENSIPNEALKGQVSGLYLIPSENQTQKLTEYYTTKPEAYRTYLNFAAQGLAPFAYIETNDVSELVLLDGAQYNLSSTKKGMIIPGNYPLGAYTVAGYVEDSAGNKKELVFTLVITRTSDNGSVKELIMPQTNLNLEVVVGNVTKKVEVKIPEGIKISGDASSTWDGTMINPPSFKDLPDVNMLKEGYTQTVSKVIEIGFAGVKLTFDKAVRILIPGEASKKVGYSHDGINFYEITDVCVDDTQATNDLLSEGGDCYMVDGSDLIIWTKHFTEFVTYDEAVIKTTTSSLGGSSICVTEWTCTDWSSCSNGVKSRTCSYPANFCKPSQAKPIEYEICEEVKPTEIVSEKEIIQKNNRNFLTGLVIDENTGKINPYPIAVFLIVVLIIVYLSIKTFKQKETKKKK